MLVCKTLVSTRIRYGSYVCDYFCSDMHLLANNLLNLMALIRYIRADKLHLTKNFCNTFYPGANFVHILKHLHTSAMLRYLRVHGNVTDIVSKQQLISFISP